MEHSLVSRPIVPVANREDAEATASALMRYLDGDSETVIAVHVIEKAGGAPDKASVEQREIEAEAIFDVVIDTLTGVNLDVQTEILYGTDIGTTIIDAAHDLHGSAIVFTPRGGSRWMKLLTGDVTTTLVNRSDLPIIVLPDSVETET